MNIEDTTFFYIFNIHVSLDPFFTKCDFFVLYTQSSDSRPESAYAYNSDPFIHAAVTGDVLADQDEEKIGNSADQPRFSMWR